MTDFLVWRDSWQLGIEELDSDHKEMMRLMNELMALRHRYLERSRTTAGEGSAPPEREMLRQLLERLIAHVRAHFEREEVFLRAIDYPGYVDHRREHLMQMAEFTDMRRCLEKEAAPCMDERAMQNLKDWFFNHVIAEDRLYADYFFRECKGRIPDPDATSDGADSGRPDTGNSGEPAQ